MTTKDYWLIVRVIRLAISRNLADNETHKIRELKAEMINGMVEDFDRELAADNERFNSQRFRRAIFGGYSIETL